jgi:hypothetical protein
VCAVSCLSKEKLYLLIAGASSNPLLVSHIVHPMTTGEEWEISGCPWAAVSGPYQCHIYAGSIFYVGKGHV